MYYEYQYELTPKGEKRLSYLDSVSIFTLTPKEIEKHSLESILLHAIAEGGGLAHEASSPEGKMLQQLEARGYIVKVEETLEDLLGRLPAEPGPATPGMGLRKAMRVYTKIAEGKLVPDEDIEALRQFLIAAAEEAFIDDEEAEETLENVLRNLRAAKTRSDKIIAIDGAISFVHAGLIPPSVPDEEVGDVMKNVTKILEKLRYE